jgi:hypothetical protein
MRDRYPGYTVIDIADYREAHHEDSHLQLAGGAAAFPNAGTYLNVMRKTDKGWRIQAHMWDDLPNQRQ